MRLPTAWLRVAGPLMSCVAVLALTRRWDAALLAGVAGLLTGEAARRLGAPAPPAPCVLWFTGLSGAGKTTLSLRVKAELEKRGLPVEHLDGDTLRDLLPSTGFSRKERDEHVRRIGVLASRLEKHGVVVIASLISPYEESRKFVRGLCGRFIEVHVSTPLSVCEARDVKGLYARARSGEIRDFTGIDSEYEPPSRPELTIDTSAQSQDEALGRILAYLQSNG
jgi:adenylylsulfate kinase